MKLVPDKDLSTAPMSIENHFFDMVTLMWEHFPIGDVL